MVNNYYSNVFSHKNNELQPLKAIVKILESLRLNLFFSVIMISNELQQSIVQCGWTNTHTGLYQAVYHVLHHCVDLPSTIAIKKCMVFYLPEDRELELKLYMELLLCLLQKRKCSHCVRQEGSS